MQESKELRGLGGWLVLVGIGLFISVIRLSYNVLAVYYPIFANGTFTAVTTQGSPLYNPLWAPILISETVVNVLLTATYAYLVYLFLRKHYVFPKVYIATVVFSVIFIPLDAWICSFVLVNQPLFDDNTLKEMVRALFGLFIWVPYMLVSKRVQATFVEHKPESADTRTVVNL